MINDTNYNNTTASEAFVQVSLIARGVYTIESLEQMLQKNFRGGEI